MFHVERTFVNVSRFQRFIIENGVTWSSEDPIDAVQETEKSKSSIVKKPKLGDRGTESLPFKSGPRCQNGQLQRTCGMPLLRPRMRPRRTLRILFLRERMLTDVVVFFGD